MKYSREWKDGSGIEELTRKSAGEIIKRWYPGIDSESLEELLNTPGAYNCKFSYVNVEED